MRSPPFKEKEVSRMPTPKERKVQLPMAQIRADFSPATINKEKRTIELVWSTGKKGLRRTWDGSYFEELSLDKGHVRMERLESGAAPLVNAHNHRWGGLEAVIGVVERAWLENGQGKAMVRFSDREEVQGIWRDIENGILKNVSVGYNVYRYERQPDVDGEEAPTYRAVDWEPVEISMVPVGFDEKAVVRGKDEPSAHCVFINNLPDKRNEEVREMSVKVKEGEKATVVDPGSTVDVEQEKKRAREEAKAAEKVRQADIRKACKSLGLSEQFAQRMIDEDHDIEKVRELAIEEKAKESDKIETRGGVQAEGGKPAHLAERKEGVVNALMHRHDPSRVKLTDAGRNFRGMSLMEIARDFLEAGGVRTRGLEKLELATRAFHSTSDFPEVLANVATKTLRQAYDEAPRTFTAWARRATLPDFKQVSRVNLGEAPELEKVLESGEIKRGTIGEAAEKYQLATYAKIVGITRQVIVNDDLDAFTRIPAKFGFAAASLESDVVYAILTANAALSDAVALFHSTHKNLGTGGVPSLTTLGEFRKLMRVQKGIDGKRTLNIALKYVIAPAALETLFDQLLVQSTVPALDSSTNPFKGKVVPIIEPRLDAASALVYYGACDPNQCDTVEYGYLEGQEGVFTETKMGFDVDGMEVKARLDFAAKAIDFRGLVKNAGA